MELSLPTMPTVAGWRTLGLWLTGAAFLVVSGAFVAGKFDGLLSSPPAMTKEEGGKLVARIEALEARPHLDLRLERLEALATKAETMPTVSETVSEPAAPVRKAKARGR